MRLPILLFALTLPWGGVSYIHAQGTRADYERAAGLRALTADKVLNADLKPGWLPGGSRFWYRKALPGGAREYVLISATDGTRQAAFDHDRMAAALSKQLGKKVEAAFLPIDKLEFLPNTNTLRVVVEGSSYLCDPQTYELRAPSEGQPSDTLPQVRERPSRSSDIDSSVTFHNQSAQEVELFWVNTEGNRQSYGKLKAGERRRQHTFAGHVWVAVGGSGQVLGVFRAAEMPAVAAIGDRPQEVQKPEPAPSKGKQREGDLSPDRKWRALIQKGNVQLASTDGDSTRELTTDAGEKTEYRGPIHWSPDSRYFVAWHHTRGGDRKVHYVESSPKDQLQPRLRSYDYLKPGDDIPQTRPALFDAEKGIQVPLDKSLWPNPWSINEFRWLPGGREFAFVYNQRGHQVLRVIAIEAATGKARAIINEESRTYIDYGAKYFLHWLPSGQELIWMSERDGWNHLYLYATTNSAPRQLTRGEWVVREVEWVDDAARELVIRAGGLHPGQDPYFVHYARVRIDDGSLTPLTYSNGTHTCQFSPDRRFVIDSFSRVDAPPVHELRSARDGRLICPLEQADAGALLRTGWRAPEPFVAKGRDDRTDIYGVIWRPMRLEPGRRYPVIEQIYAGPQSAFTPKAFRSYYQAQYLAELGFIVVQMDGMGTSHRSKAFHDVSWKNLADAGFPDRIRWIKAAAAKEPAMDLSRVGIYGGSAGGQNALRALLSHGDFYHAAVADCGCHDNRMDKIWWNELYMSWPVGAHYIESSNVEDAHKLRGKLLLIVGEKDENVDPASTYQVVNALIKADKDFDFLVITGAGHGAAETPYGSRRRADHFVHHLLGVEPRWDPSSATPSR